MTSISTTLQPSLTLDVDAAELESLTRQGLVVGVPPVLAPTSPPDTVTAHLRATVNPRVLLGVGAAELESLTRQGLIYSEAGGYGTGPYGTSGYGD